MRDSVACPPRACTSVHGPPLRLCSIKAATPTHVPTPHCSVELPTADVQSAMRLTGVVQGRGAAIVVSAVAPGSAAAAAGVRVGQQLLAVSDPVRRTEMWDLNAQASLRYVRQAIRMRVSESIELKLSAAPIPEWQQVVTARRAAATAAAAPPAAQQQQPDDAAASGASMDSAGDDLLSAIVQEAEALRSGSSFDAADSAARSAATAPTSAAAGALTVADRLAAKYAAEQAGEAGEAPQRERALTDLERRQRRRKEYFEQARCSWLRCVGCRLLVVPCAALSLVGPHAHLPTRGTIHFPAPELFMAALPLLFQPPSAPPPICRRPASATMDPSSRQWPRSL